MASDFAPTVPPELESVLRLKTVEYFLTRRPWLDLYGVNVRPVAPVGSASRKPYVDSALIHRCLPDEMLSEVFARMSLADVWSGRKLQDLAFKYESSWRKMWLLRPRLRIDGLYVSRNTYIRVGVAEWKTTNPVHVVCYFRYMRFFPSGRFLYKNSSEKIKKVAKCMNFRSSKADCVFGGHYTLSDDKVEAAVLYAGRWPTVLRIRLRLRGTTAGANNRMDLISLVTSGGMTPFVFVPFDEVETSVFNLPLEKMDYFVPG
ncbi:hypothetical protein K1719_015911 [Acacia pycnantha]|nr:hypothetical protein K1719_015911 [Acacia pycnantha]